MTATTHRGRTLAERGLARLTVDLPHDAVEQLAETSLVSGYNKTTTLMRAIRLLADLTRHVRAGGEVLLVAADGSKERLRLL